MECFRIVSYLLVFTIASGKDIQRTPALLLVGTKTGEILKCNLDNPEKCEIFYSNPSSVFYSTVVRGEYLYASYQSGEILRCEFYTKESCTVFYKAKTLSYCLSAVGEYLYAGLDDGTVLRCKLNQPNTCSNFHSFPHPVRGIFEYGKYIYVATWFSLSYCQKDVPFSCSGVTVNKTRWLWHVAHTGSVVVIVHPWKRYVTSYTLTSTNALIRIKDVTVLGTIRSITVLKSILYVLDVAGYIKTCQADKECNFKNLVRHENASSISTLYRVHHMRNGYTPKESCNQESSPLAVFNYDVERRAMLEVSVVDGVLCDARGAAVDTRRADRGHSGRAAVFAMGPDGQLLLSHAHRSGLVHISSLFAGHPVAGVGEIVVEDGVVKRIIACSLYYLPDVTLNRQVVDELISKGYDSDSAEEIGLEECVYTCDREISDEL